MSDVSPELLIKELSARLEELETKNKAHEIILNTLVVSFTREQKNVLISNLKSKFDLAINQGALGLRETFESQKKAVESVVGRLG